MRESARSKSEPKQADREAPRGAAARSARAALHDQLGNRGLTELLRRRAEARPRAQALRELGVLAKLELGAVDDPLEREADELAACALAPGKPPCCSSCADGLGIRRAPDPAAQGRSSAGPSTPSLEHRQLTALGPGAPLSGGDRAFFEARLAGEFGSVRVHAGPAASALARSVGARAFAFGDQLVFGQSEYDPHSERGRRLLAHELVHTQQAARAEAPVVRRDDLDAGVPDVPDAGVPDVPDAGVPDVPDAGVSDAGGSDSPPSTPPPADFDPCAVDVASLTNGELLAEYVRAEAYIRDPQHHRRDDFYAYRWLWRRVGEERNRRARAGETWLADTSLRSVPSSLYRLEPGPHDSVLVMREAGSAASGPPRTYADASVLSESQLQDYMRRNHVGEATREQVLANPDEPHLVDVVTANMVWQLSQPEPAGPPGFPTLLDPGLGGMAGTFGVGRRPSPLAQQIHRGFGIGYDLNYNSVLKYQGLVGEYGFLALDPLHAGPYVDLNIGTGGTARDYDFLQPEQRLLPQVKTRYGPSAEPALTSAYVSGIESIELNPSSPEREARTREFLAQLGREHDVHLGPWVALEGGRLVVNAEDVPLVAAERARRIREGGPEFNAQLYRALLWANEIQHLGQRYTVVDFNRDLRAGTVPEAITDAVATLAAERIVPGVPGDQVMRVTDLLSSRVSPSASPREAAGALRPLEIEAALRGRSLTRAAALSGAGGDLVGGSLALALMRARAAMTGQAYPRTLAEDLRGFAISTPVAAGSSALELRLTDAALQHAARGTPVPAYLRPGFVRAGLPAITAPLVTMASMGIDSHSYPWQEYAVASTRSTVNALVAAGFLATVGAFGTGGAEVGAAGGTLVEPGGGTLLGGAGGWLVGVIVGTGVYMLSDFLIGDTVEDVARSAVGDPPGCPR